MPTKEEIQQELDRVRLQLEQAQKDVVKKNGQLEQAQKDVEKKNEELQKFKHSKKLIRKMVQNQRRRSL